MKSFHFSLGDSSKGPIGFCARVKAATPEDAAEILRDRIGDHATIRTGDEYIEVYFNADAISAADIDEVDE